MVAPSRFCHAVFKTRRFAPMVEFYKYALDARIQFCNDVVAFLTYDDEHHRIAIAKMPGALQPEDDMPRVTGLAHLAFAWDGLDALLEKYCEMKKAGILPVRTIRHGPTLSLYYEDPDRNQLEFQIDVLTMEEAAAFMQSDAFAQNSSGELFDPEMLLRRYRAGDVVDDLVYRSDQAQHSGQKYMKDG